MILKTEQGKSGKENKVSTTYIVNSKTKSPSVELVLFICEKIISGGFIPKGVYASKGSAVLVEKGVEYTDTGICTIRGNDCEVDDVPSIGFQRWQLCGVVQDQKPLILVDVHALFLIHVVVIVGLQFRQEIHALSIIHSPG